MALEQAAFARGSLRATAIPRAALLQALSGEEYFMPNTGRPLSPMLKKLMKWSKLDEADQRAVLDLPYQLRTIRRYDSIVHEGDHPDRSCLLVEGYAFRHKVVGTGGRQILALHVAGDIVDLQNALLRTADHNVQALTDASVAFIPVAAVVDIAFERPRVGLAMWYDTLVDASIHREWTANIGRRNAKARMSHLLCEFGVRLEDAGLGSLRCYELPMTQEELADALGLTSIHVNRTLRELDREGLVERNKKSVFITDWQRLALAGDFDSAYLHIADEQSGMGAGFGRTL